MTAKSLRFCIALLALATAASHAATINIVNPNAPGLGTSDTTPRAPEGGNPGTTVGAQRLFVFEKAAAQWGLILNSAAAIRVNAQMTALTCSGTTAVLGSAGPNSVFSDFPGATKTGTWYVEAEANAVAGADQDGASDDIDANFNVDLDNGTCLTGVTGWWYGVDPSVAVPADKIPLLPVVFHELGHGLGFLSLTDSSTGKFCCGSNPNQQLPDIWAYYMRDAATAKLWSAMTANERKASAINDPNLTWVGKNVNRVQDAYLGPAPALIVNAPAAIAGSNPAQPAQFGPPVPSAGITQGVVLAVDASLADSSGGNTGTFNDACQPLTNAALAAGKIVLAERGACNFTVKVKNAQLANAIGVIVQNNVAAGLPGMGGSDATITIPSYGISQALGTSIRNNIALANVTMGYTSTNSGTTGGCVRLYAPATLEPGSSVSHFTADATPDLLMEPALNETIFNKVDLTLELFKDIGWSTNLEDLLFFDGFDANRCNFVQP